jgi:long-chain acyl-CoA synthetase
MSNAPQNLGLLFRDTASRLPDKTALLFKQGGRYEKVAYSELSRRIHGLAAWFVDQGLRPGDRVAILSENRPEWAYTDLAALSAGLVVVPVYPSLSSAEIEYILSDSSASIIAVSGKSLCEKLIPIQKSLTGLKRILSFEAAASVIKDDFSIPFFVLKEVEELAADPKVIDSRLDNVKSDDIATIIYTSGTTGPPKGVLLTHANLIHNVLFSKKALSMSQDEIHLSFLPLSHIFERMAGHYLMIHLGATIGYAENMDAVPQNLLEVRPTFIMGVPRFYEKIKERILKSINAASNIQKGIFHWAQAVGETRRNAYEKGSQPSFWNRIQSLLAERLVYRKIKRRLGGRVRHCVSGGAALPGDVAKFFCDLGIVIYEGYGLTETSPVISANRENRYKFGTVGIPLEEVEVKISEEGEILTRGVCVMKGYLNKPRETAEALKDGWFHTGDLGKIDADGFLSITGRKKELIVTSGGKKIASRLIEEIVEKDPFILRCVLFGEGKKFITALIVPREDKLTEYAKNEKIAFQSYANLLENPRVYDFFEARIADLSGGLANFEKIKYFVLLERDFTQASGELTPTLKVKREEILSRHKDKLLALYEKDIRN